MKNSKVLEMINQGRIEELKDLLRDDIYQEALKGKHGAKQRYAAMKKYFTYVRTAREVCKKPYMIEFEGRTVTSFCNAYSLALTTEPCGAIELFDPANGNYPDVGRLVNREGGPNKVNFNKAFAEAKSKGYRLSKTEVNGGRFMFHYNGAYFRIGLFDATVSIIDDGGDFTVYHNGKNVSPIIIENDIGVCLILPVKCDSAFIEEHGITVIDI